MVCDSISSMELKCSLGNDNFEWSKEFTSGHILGNNQCFELYASNIYRRGVLSGKFVIVYKLFLHDLTEIGHWYLPMKNAIMHVNGFAQKN